MKAELFLSILSAICLFLAILLYLFLGYEKISYFLVFSGFFLVALFPIRITDLLRNYSADSNKARSMNFGLSSLFYPMKAAIGRGFSESYPLFISMMCIALVFIALLKGDQFSLLMYVGTLFVFSTYSNVLLWRSKG